MALFFSSSSSLKINSTTPSAHAVISCTTVSRNGGQTCSILLYYSSFFLSLSFFFFFFFAPTKLEEKKERGWRGSKESASIYKDLVAGSSGGPAPDCPGSWRGGCNWRERGTDFEKRRKTAAAPLPPTFRIAFFPSKFSGSFFFLFFFEGKQKTPRKKVGVKFSQIYATQCIEKGFP